MAAINYYMGVKRGGTNNQFAVVSGTSSAGTAVDVEVRMQIDNGTAATGLTSLDVEVAIETLKSYLHSSGLNHAGTNLPPL